MSIFKKDYFGQFTAHGCITLSKAVKLLRH